VPQSLGVADKPWQQNRRNPDNIVGFAQPSKNNCAAYENITGISSLLPATAPVPHRSQEPAALGQNVDLQTSSMLPQMEKKSLFLQD